MNSQKEMEDIISSLNGKPKLLLHSCCAPCFSGCYERLIDHFDLTVFYYNPNIDGKEEYDKRLSEQERLCKTLGIKFIGTEFNRKDFLCSSIGLEKEKEGGLRCHACFRLRLTETAKTAKEKGYDFFATTLTLSPLKNAELINRIGKEIEAETGVKYLVSDFKKKGGYLRSIELSKQYGLYRQNYCGCEFSKNKN